MNPQITFREIDDSNLASVAELLARGFPKRRHEFWRRALNRLTEHQPPPGVPTYGYFMEAQGIPVGVVLTIFSTSREGDALTTRCNPCAWYVDAPFRAYAGLLFAKAVAGKNVTYVNVSPAPHTLQMMEALGFSRYCNGLFVAIPVLTRASGARRAVIFSARREPSVSFDPFEQELLARHATQGCISLWCATTDKAYPFVFRRRWIGGLIPCMQMIYCNAVEDFVQFAAPIGRFLARRGAFFVIVDANNPISGLFGLYRHGSALKYFKGPQRPRLGDLAYTEFAVLGI